MLIVNKEIPIYGGWFKVYVTNDFEKMSHKIKANLDNPNGCSGIAFTRSNPKNSRIEYSIFIKEEYKDDWSTIAHECLHTINSIFLDVGVELDRINDEPQAYMMSWLINEIQLALHKDNK